jgi:hypothetical protein
MRSSSFSFEALSSLWNRSTSRSRSNPLFLFSWDLLSVLVMGVLLSLSLSVKPAIAASTPAPSARPTAAPTEHATYLSAAAAAGNTTIKPNQFYGPYAIDYNQQIHFNFSTSSCDSNQFLYIYVEVLQGDADIHVGSTSSTYTGSDYVAVSCGGADMDWRLCHRQPRPDHNSVSVQFHH